MVLTSAITAISASQWVFISPNGNDLNRGTREQPLASLADASIQAILFVSPSGKGTAFTKAAPGPLYGVVIK